MTVKIADDESVKKFKACLATGRKMSKAKALALFEKKLKAGQGSVLWSPDQERMLWAMTNSVLVSIVEPSDNNRGSKHTRKACDPINAAQALFNGDIFIADLGKKVEPMSAELKDKKAAAVKKDKTAKAPRGPKVDLHVIMMPLPKDKYQALKKKTEDRVGRYCRELLTEATIAAWEGAAKKITKIEGASHMVPVRVPKALFERVNKIEASVGGMARALVLSGGK